MNILILTGSFGMGHNSVSQAIKEQILSHQPKSKVFIKDIIKVIAPKSYNIIYNSFNFLVKHGKLCYNLYHKLTKNFEYSGNLILRNYLDTIFNTLVENIKPDYIISTLPICTMIALSYKEKTKSSIPVITCVTDITKHNEWFNSKCDYYIVPTNSIKNSYINKGFSADKIIVNGIPVKKVFSPSNLSFSNKAKELLIMGGGLGLIPNCTNLFDFLNKEDNISTTIIVGKNIELYNFLTKRYSNINIISYTNKVAYYMKKADLIITKPGGVSLFEAINTETALLCLKPFLSQEYENASFIESEGLGKVLWNTKENINDVVKDTIFSESKLSYFKANLTRVRRQSLNNSFLSLLTERKSTQYDSRAV